MAFFSEAEIPGGLDGDAFVLEPLTVGHVVLDYEAVMAGRVMLRLWSGTEWPSDDFTEAENFDDLERHQREHERREAFTFTVLTPDRRRCVGCVYLTPLETLFEQNPAIVSEAPDGAAVVGHWVVPDEFDRIGRMLLDELVKWMRSDWPFPGVYFAVAQGLEQQHHLMRAARLVPRFEVTVPRRDGLFVLYEPP